MPTPREEANVQLNKAEIDALQQIADRHGDVLDKFERDLLARVIRKAKMMYKPAPDEPTEGKAQS